MKKARLWPVAIVGSLAFVACVGDDPGSVGTGSSSSSGDVVDATGSSGSFVTPPSSSGSQSGSSSGVTSGSSSSSGDAPDADASLPPDPRCDVTVALQGPTLPGPLCGVRFLALPAAALAVGEYDLTRLDGVDGGENGDVCVDEPWQASLEVLSDPGGQWLFNLTVKLPSGVHNYHTKIRVADDGENLEPQPLCPEPSPYFATESGAKFRVVTSSGKREIQVGIHHPNSNAFRQAAFTQR